MALNKKACARVAAVLVDELGAITTQTLLRRITKAADTNNKSFRKTIKRISKASVVKRATLAKRSPKLAA
jgi:hypothetical protein